MELYVRIVSKKCFPESDLLAICNNACQNGGVCIAPNTCDCTGTNYSGALCTIRMLEPSCSQRFQLSAIQPVKTAVFVLHQTFVTVL